MLCTETSKLEAQKQLPLRTGSIKTRTDRSLLICTIRDGALYMIQLLKQVGLDYI